MGNLDEIRSITKRLLREDSPSLQQYEDAMPLCKELYEAFPETHELWDVHQYANCLKNSINLMMPSLYVKMSILNSKIKIYLKNQIVHFYILKIFRSIYKKAAHFFRLYLSFMR